MLACGARVNVAHITGVDEFTKLEFNCTIVIVDLHNGVQSFVQVGAAFSVLRLFYQDLVVS